MWKKLIIPKAHIKYETERAIQLRCPYGSKQEGWQCWYPKKLVQIHRFGSYVYAEISVETEMKLRFTRYVSKYRPPLELEASGELLFDCFYQEHLLSSLRFEHQAMNTEADRAFESDMQGLTRPPLPNYFDR